MQGGREGRTLQNRKKTVLQLPNVYNIALKLYSFYLNRQTV